MDKCTLGEVNKQKIEDMGNWMQNLNNSLERLNENIEHLPERLKKDIYENIDLKIENKIEKAKEEMKKETDKITEDMRNREIKLYRFLIGQGILIGGGIIYIIIDKLIQ